jgi:hypothetical protein
MEKIIWYSVDLQLPQDGQKVTFKPTENNNANNLEFDGIYIKSEDMFFIGFEETGDFLFSSQVAFWKLCDERK